MKQSYIYLLIILSIFRLALPMIGPDEIKEYYENARQSEREGKIDEALTRYKTIIDINIPPPQSSGGFILRDPYSVELKLQRESSDAIWRLEDQILAKARELIRQKKYDEAEQQLNIGLINQDSIDAAEELKPQIIQGQIDNFKKEFQKLVTTENYPGAQNLLNRTLNVIGPNEFQKYQNYLKNEQTKTQQKQEQLEQKRLEQEGQSATVKSAQAKLTSELNAIKTLIANKQYTEAKSRLAKLPAEESQVIQLKNDVEIAHARNLADNNQYNAAFDILTPLINKNIAEAIALDTQLIKELPAKIKNLVNANKNADATKIINIVAQKRPGREARLDDELKSKQMLAMINKLQNEARNATPARQLDLYTQITNITIPAEFPGRPDPYQEVRVLHKNALDQKIKLQLDKVQTLSRTGKYTEALVEFNKISPYGQNTAQAKEIKEKIDAGLKKTPKEIELEQKAVEQRKKPRPPGRRPPSDIVKKIAIKKEEEKYRPQLLEAAQLANEDKYQEAYAILTPLYQKEGIVAAKELEDQLIGEQITAAKLHLNQNDFDSARAVLNVLKTKKPSEAEPLEQEMQAAEQIYAQSIKDIDSDYKAAEQRKQDGNTAGALELYKKIAAVKIPAASPYWFDSYKKQRNLQQDAKNKIVFLETIKPEIIKAEQLAGRENYIEALDLLDKIPAEHRTAREVTNAKNRIENQEKTWTNEQLQKARNLINEKNYQQAKVLLDALKRKTALLEAHKLQKQVDKLLQAKAHVGRNYGEAYKLLDELINEGFTEAIEIKKEIEESQQRIANAASRSPEDVLAEVITLFGQKKYGDAQIILEQLKRRPALASEISNQITNLQGRIDNEQRRLREDAARQEEERRRRLAQEAEDRERRTRSAQDLKNTFVRLTATLKSISSYIRRR